MISRNHALMSILAIKKSLLYCSGISFFMLSFASKSMAANVEIESLPCYFFRGEKLTIEQKCSYHMVSWTGGGVIKLVWQDGIKTDLQFGLQGRGERICPPQGPRPFDSMAVDKVCSSNYLRAPESLKIISQDEASRLGRAVQCTRVNRNSVCWMR
jgi:hypothetical protein